MENDPKIVSATKELLAQNREVIIKNLTDHLSLAEQNKLDDIAQHTFEAIAALLKCRK